MAGYCTRIDVTLLADGGCQVIDDGRGIPVGIHPEHRVSASRSCSPMLHAGGKFGGSGYKVSGGLHGVGVSVVNALSSASSWRSTATGKRYRMEFARRRQGQRQAGRRWRRARGGAAAPPSPSGPMTVFETIEFTRSDDPRPAADDGLPQPRSRDPLHRRTAGPRGGAGRLPVPRRHHRFREAREHHKEPLFSKVGYFEQSEDDQEVEVAFQWNTGYQTDGLHSFANGINTIEGGTHVEGFRAALTTVINRYARAKGHLKGKKTTSSARISAKVSPRSFPCACATHSSRDKRKAN